MINYRFHTRSTYRIFAILHFNRGNSQRVHNRRIICNILTKTHTHIEIFEQFDCAKQRANIVTNGRTRGEPTCHTIHGWAPVPGYQGTHIWGPTRPDRFHWPKIMTGRNSVRRLTPEPANRVSQAVVNRGFGYTVVYRGVCTLSSWIESVSDWGNINAFRLKGFVLNKKIV